MIYFVRTNDGEMFGGVRSGSEMIKVPSIVVWVVLMKAIKDV
jgi:hypothetical protein